MLTILPTMYKAYLLTGSNLGDRFGYMRQAMQLIEQSGCTIIQTSGFYRTAAWGMTDQPDFFNQAIALETDAQPGKLMQKLLQIEQQIGRKREIKMGPRIIDIDILMIDGEIINTPSLTVPHPFLAERRFALMPLAEIAADVVHPVFHKTVAQLLAECPDTLSVNKIYI